MSRMSRVSVSECVSEGNEGNAPREPIAPIEKPSCADIADIDIEGGNDETPCV